MESLEQGVGWGQWRGEMMCGQWCVGTGIEAIGCAKKGARNRVQMERMLRHRKKKEQRITKIKWEQEQEQEQGQQQQ